jgi:hypothetical protein
MAELKIRFDLTFSRRFIIAAGAAAVMLCAVPELDSESVQLSTYYPAPSGVYTQMITTGNTWLARDGSGVAVGGGAAAPGQTLDVRGTMGVSGPTNFASAMTVGGLITANGGLTLNGPMTIGGDLAVGGNSSTAGASTVGGAAVVGGDASVGGSVLVGGGATIAADAVIGGTLYATGRVANASGNPAFIISTWADDCPGYGWPRNNPLGCPAGYDWAGAIHVGRDDGCDWYNPSAPGPRGIGYDGEMISGGWMVLCASRGP